MKRYKDIYQKIYDYDNLYLAYLSARLNKRHRSEVMAFTEHLEENLVDVQNVLIWQTYEV